MKLWPTVDGLGKCKMARLPAKSFQKTKSSTEEGTAEAVPARIHDGCRGKARLVGGQSRVWGKERRLAWIYCRKRAQSRCDDGRLTGEGQARTVKCVQVEVEPWNVGL